MDSFSIFFNRAQVDELRKPRIKSPSFPALMKYPAPAHIVPTGLVRTLIAPLVNADQVRPSLK